MLAALMNGTTSHTFDFDDTHLKTVIHPSGPVASALLALAMLVPLSAGCAKIKGGDTVPDTGAVHVTSHLFHF